MFKRLVFTVLTVSTATNGYAVPFQSNKCSASLASIKHPKNAQGVLSDEDCTTAYVLPPDVGSVRIEAIAPTANLNFCPAVNDIPLINRRYVALLDSILKRIELLLSGFDPQKDELNKLRNRVDELKTDLDRLESKFQETEKEEQILFGEKKLATRDVRDCKATEELDCSEEKAEQISTQKIHREFYKNTFLPARNAFEDAKAEYTKVNKKFIYESSQFTQSLSPMFELQSQARNLNRELLDLYNDYARVQGFTAQAVYTVNWSGILNGYQEQNKKLNLAFVKVPVLSSKVYASAKVDGKDMKIPTLLHAAIPGVGDFGMETLGKEDMEIKPDDNIPRRLEVGLGLGDANISGQMTLSLVGACPFFPEGLATKRDSIKENEMAAHLVVNATYEYPMKVRRKYSAEYNLAQFMKRVEEKSRSTGWFSAKDTHSIVEDSNSTDWFKIKFDADDPDFHYTGEEQSAISKDVKLNLIERSMKAVASMSFGESSVPPIPNLPESGGAFVSHGRFCSLWAYCYGTSYFLGTLFSKIGSKSAVSEFTKHNNVWTHEDVSQVAVMRRTTTLTFSPKR